MGVINTVTKLLSKELLNALLCTFASEHKSKWHVCPYANTNFKHIMVSKELPVLLIQMVSKELLNNADCRRWPPPKPIEHISVLLQIYRSQMLGVTSALWHLVTFITFQYIKILFFPSQVQVMSGSHSMVQHTRTTVSWTWRTLV